MQQVRTVFQPDTPIEVPDDEYQVLKAGGLLADDPTPAAKKPRTADQPPAAAPDTASDVPSPAADTTTKKG